jgi:GTP pyrophosphokinase
VTKNNGVMVHRSDCKNIARLIKNPEHFLDAQWEVEHDENFLVRLQALGHDRKNFLRDLSAAIAETHANVVSVRMNTQEAFIQGQVVVEIKNLLHLTQVIKKISKVNGVINVERLDGTGEPLANLAGAPSPLWTNAN